MKDALITAFLQAVGTKREGQSSKWAQAKCPLAFYRHAKGTDSTPSFGISRGATTTHTKCFACGFKGSPFALLMEIRRLEQQTPSPIKRDIKTALRLVEEQDENEPLIASEDEYQFATLHVFPESYLDRFELAYTETEVHPYLQGRAVNCSTARRLDIRWDATAQRVCFPVRDFHGRLCGVHGRTALSKDELPEDQPVYRVYRYKEQSNTQVWSGEHMADLTQPVLLVESVFDLARVYPIWPNVLSPRMAGFSESTLLRLDGAVSIVTLFDHDSAGDMARNTASRLKGASITHLSCAPHKDPGETPLERLEEILGSYQAKSLISLAYSDIEP